MWRSCFSLCLVVLIILAGCSSFPEPAGMADLSPVEEKGWKLFGRESCFPSCHVETIASPGTASFTGFTPNLRKTPWRSRDWYMAYLTNPRAVLPWSPMPSYGYLSTDDIEALAAFLHRLNRSASASGPKPVSPEKIPETAPGLARYSGGRSLYLTYCVGCHGEFGNGGGQVGHLLSPEPRDFTDTLWMSKQTETYLFSVTTNGKPNTAMPPFNEILNARERALVVRYIQYFADPVARQRMELGLVLK